MSKFLVLALALFLLSPAIAQEQVIEVTSEPPGALVVVNHRVKGRTPLTLTELEPGKHHFRVSHGPEYRPFQQEIEVRPNHTEACHVVLSPITETSLKQGVRLLQEGQIAAAEEALHRALRESPRQPEAYLWLGKLAYERNEDDKAVEYIREYAQVFPEDSQAHLLLGRLHQRGGRTGAAYTSYKLALLNTVEMKQALQDMPPATWEAIKEAGAPVAPIYQMRLAHLYELKGRTPEALEWVEKAVNEIFSDQMLNSGQI
ncbi:MAG: tetratricopeptide repeat protein [Vulcanimicrobiota bacterium]